MIQHLFQNLKYLEEFKSNQDTAVITDIDGTISNIAPTPGEARVTPSMRSDLIKLKKKFRLVAFISGRSALNAYDMVKVEGMLYVGSHGLEYLKNGERHIEIQVKDYLPLIDKLKNEIAGCEISQLPGFICEDKELCLSLHYRQCENPEQVREKIMEVLGTFPESKSLKIRGGRKVIDIRPPVGYDKGLIIEKIVEQYQLTRVIYLGDDVTDADAFNKLKELEKRKIIKGVSILVCSMEIPDYVKKSASFYLENVDEVQKFFKWLLS